MPGRKDKTIKTRDSIENSLSYYLSLGNINTQEMLQITTMITSNEKVLSQHKAPIRLLKGKSKRWKTRLPNGRQIVKTQYSDLIKALTDYYSSLKPSKSDSTLKSLYLEWIQLRELEVSPNTYYKTIRSWKKYFESSNLIDIPIKELNKSQLKAWSTQLIKNNNMTKHYFNSEVKSIINGLLDFATDKDIVPVNKFRGIKINSRVFKPARLKEENEEIFTLEEQQLIIDEAIKDSKETNSPIPLGIVILFYTGVRIGELCALKYGDIYNNILTIQRMQVSKKIKVGDKMVCDGYEITNHTKTCAGYRKIYLPEKAMEYFNLIKKMYQENGYTTLDDDYIFRRTNRYINMQNDDLANSRVFDSRIRKYCKKLGFVFTKSSHDIRRSYITLLYESGMNIDTIRRIAGHENIEMTLNYCRGRNTSEMLTTQIENAFKIV